MNRALLSRRGFVSGAGGLTASVLLAPEAMAGKRRPRPNLRGGKFAEGVASGDPATRAITLWTRIGDVEGTGTVEVQVARDRGFRKVVARDLIKTTDAGAHYAKARVAGLKPYEEYFYRFATRDEQSPVGRFRTALPPDSNHPVRFAFFSCQDFTFGLLQRPRADGQGGPRLRGLPRRLHLRRGLLPDRPDGGRARRPGGQRRDARPVPRQVRRLPHRSEPCGASTPASR